MILRYSSSLTILDLQIVLTQLQYLFRSNQLTLNFSIGLASPNS